MLTAFNENISSKVKGDLLRPTLEAMQALSINIDIKDVNANSQHTRLVSKLSVWRLSPDNVRARSLCACAYWRMVSGVRPRDGGCHDIVSRVTHRCHTNTSHVSPVSQSILNNELRHVAQQARITFNWSNWGNDWGLHKSNYVMNTNLSCSNIW